MGDGLGVTDLDQIQHYTGDPGANRQCHRRDVQGVAGGGVTFTLKIMSAGESTLPVSFIFDHEDRG